MERVLDVRAGEEKVVGIVLVVDEDAGGDGNEAPDPGSSGGGLLSTRLGLGLAGVGVGVAGGVASVVLGVMSLGKADDVEALRGGIAADPAAPRENPCGSGTVTIGSCAELSDAVDSEVTLRNTAIGVGVASAAVLIGGVLVLTIPMDEGVEIGASTTGLIVKGSF